MKHAGPAALAQLSPLLAKLRKRNLLREKKTGIFYLRSRAFVHFHEDTAGLFADLRLADDFVRLPATTRAQQAKLLAQIDKHLAGLASAGK